MPHHAVLFKDRLEILQPSPGEVGRTCHWHDRRLRAFCNETCLINHQGDARIIKACHQLYSACTTWQADKSRIKQVYHPWTLVYFTVITLSTTKCVTTLPWWGWARWAMGKLQFFSLVLLEFFSGFAWAVQRPQGFFVEAWLSLHGFCWESWIVLAFGW